jgi:hypothetical protein
MGPVAAGEISCIAGPSAAIGALQARMYRAAGLVEIEQLCPMFDLDAERGQPVSQEPLMFILGKNQRVREWTDVRAELAEDDVGALVARNPNVCGHGPATPVRRRALPDQSACITRACEPERQSLVKWFPAAPCDR